MDDCDALFLEQRRDEVFVVDDLDAGLAGLADRRLDARIDVERALRLGALACPWPGSAC